MDQISTQNDMLIDEQEPFKNCKFLRQEKAEILENILKYTKSNAVVNLSAPWGYGKTTFLKMFQQQLQNNKTVCIYFSAWEYDYIEDPFSALIAHIQKELNKNEDIREQSSLKKMFDTVMPVVANIGLKATTANILDLKAIETIFSPTEETEKNIAKEVGNMAQNVLSNYIKVSDEIVIFKNALEEFAKVQNGEYITIIIDELDRCRPDFSIKMLERVKHIMSVPGVKFVLGTDKEQLTESIKVLYGNNFDSVHYLERFIDFEYELDIPDKKEYISMLIEEFNIIDIVNDKSIDSDFRDEKLILLASEIVTLSNIDLRLIRNLFFKLHLVVIGIDKVNYKNEKNKSISIEYLFYKLLTDKIGKEKEEQLYADINKMLEVKDTPIISLIACEKYYKDTARNKKIFVNKYFNTNNGYNDTSNIYNNNYKVANYLSELEINNRYMSEDNLKKYLKFHNNFKFE